jgi:D-threo-aldose 1-dehydrogenase
MNMNTRREFLSTALKRGDYGGSDRVFSEAVSASEIADMSGSIGVAEASGSDGKRHYKPPFKFGMGGVPLGNEFEVVTNEDAYATIEAAWNASVRYFDMSPGIDLAWLSAGTGSSFTTRSGANTLFPPKWASCLRPRKRRRIRSTSHFLLHLTM